MSLFESISETFQRAQKSVACHPKQVQKLKKIYLQSKDNKDEKARESFMDSYKKCIHIVLKENYNVSNPYVNRLLEFVSSFCKASQQYYTENVDPAEDSEIVKETFAFLLQMSNMFPDNIRFRACQFICAIMTAMQGYDLTTELCDSIEKAMLESIDDKIAQTRVLAVSALAPLQDLTNEECPIIAALLDHMECDPSVKVRKICAEKVVLKQDVIPRLLESSRDIDVNVKIAVFRRALKSPDNFKSIYKQQLIFNGLIDQPPIVKKFVAQEMIPAWLQACDFNHIKLLGTLRLDPDWDDVEMTTKVLELLLGALFALRPSVELIASLQLDDESKLVDSARLDCDVAIFWRYFIEQLRERNVEDADDYFPQLPAFCEYVKNFCKVSAHLNIMHFQFILVQLFLIAKQYEYVDCALCKCMNDLIAHIFVTYNLDREVVNVIMVTLNITIRNVDEQTKFICDLLTEELVNVRLKNNQQKENNENEKNLKTDTKREYKVALLKVNYHSLQEQFDDAVKEKDFAKAKELKPKVDAAFNELNTFTGTQTAIEKSSVTLRVLTVMAGFLTSSKLTSMNASLHIFKINIIDKHINSEDVQIRLASLRCLGICCIIDEHIAKMNLPTFCAIIARHIRRTTETEGHLLPELLIICIGTVVDCLFFFGRKMLDNPPSENSIMSLTSSLNDEQEGITLTSIMGQLLKLLNDDNTEIQFVAGRGLCNFILASRLQSPAIVSRLILKYIAPTSDGLCDEHSLKLQQYIGGLLEKLPFIPGSSKQLTKAILPTIRIILKASQLQNVNHALVKVDVGDVVILLLNLCGSYKEAEEISVNLAAELFDAISREPNSQDNVIYTKMLLMLELPLRDKDYLRELDEKVDNFRDELLDHNSKVAKNVIKLKKKIQALIMNSSSSSVGDAENSDNSEATSQS